ncbi:MAG: alkaline phosphatase family protein [Candidatus Obscuribacterales bacterium]|nr:alkaline phosphatase family protein [Candidatus Obscuribacterales bacterium]
MSKPKQWRLAMSALLSSLVLLSSFGANQAQAQSDDNRKPKLVVMIVADQLSYDYLARYRDKFGAGGLRYLIDNGANFTNCRFRQLTSHTACGDTIISTGAYPWATGIIADDWFDRRKGKEVSATADDQATIVGGQGLGASAKAMLGTTIGDQMKLATNGRSRVVTVSIGERPAVFLAGRLADEAYWWDTRSGSFVTSSQYSRSLPSWAQSFNNQRFADKYFGQTWQRLLNETQYSASSRDDYTYEKPLPGDGKQFPHVITGGATGPSEKFYSTFAMTPFANQMVSDFAKEAIDKEGLGQRPDPDLIAINFGAGEGLGEHFGPYSQEVQDLVLRLDQTLANLFQTIDQKVGLDKCLIVLTADHGIAPIPEFLKEKGLDAGRIDPKAFKTLVDSALDAKLGADDWVESFVPPNVYLNLNAIDRQKYRQPDVEAVAAKIARSVPGVGDVYTAVQFFMNQVPSGPLADAVRKNYFWGRSGELVVITKPGWIFSSEQNGTEKGSPYAYDTQVPLIISGFGIKGGSYATTASPADIAPTVAAILGIDQPSLAEGRALSESLGQMFGPPKPRSLANQQ